MQERKLVILSPYVYNLDLHILQNEHNVQCLWCVQVSVILQLLGHAVKMKDVSTVTPHLFLQSAAQPAVAFSSQKSHHIRLRSRIYPPA